MVLSGDRQGDPMKAINVSTTLLLLSLATVLPAFAQPHAYITNYGDSTVTVVDTATNAAIATIPVGASPNGIAVSADGGRVYVANRGSSSVSVIDAGTNTVVATIPVGANPTGVALSPDGLRLYVPSLTHDTLHILDALTYAPLGTVATGDRPHGVAVSPANGDVYVANLGDDTVRHYSANGTLQRTVAVGDAPLSIDVDPAGRLIYVGNSLGGTVSVLDTVGAVPVATIPVTGNPQAVAFSPDGTIAYAGMTGTSSIVEISTATSTVAAVLPIIGGVRGLSVSANGSFLYATTQSLSRLQVLSTDTRAVVGFVPMGSPRPLGQFVARPLAGKGGMGAGHHQHCRIRGDASISCWGRNDAGLVSAAPVAGQWRSVVSGSAHACALNVDGSVLCWGNNSLGQLAAPGGVFTQISAGFRHTCGIREDRTVACWGEDLQGQASPPGGAFSQVEGGSSHTCGIRGDGSIECWGRNADNQSSPVPAGSFQQLALGASFSCGLRSDGQILCWGSNTDNRATPPSGQFTQIAAEASYACGLRTNGQIACWGTDAEGQQSPPAGAFAALSLARTSACALRQDGTIECWGDNYYAQAPQMQLPATLPDAQVAQPYSASAALAQTNYSFRPPYVAQSPAYVLDGSLPPGLSMDSAGLITGTPTLDGVFTFSILAEDANGFSDEAHYTMTVVLSPPVITPVVTGTLGTNGWYTGNVAISWVVTDAETPVTSTTGCGPSTQTVETAGTPFTCQATSAGGTSQQTVVIKLDKTNPTLSPIVAPNRILLNGVVSTTINGADALSGVQSATCVPGDTSSVGAKSTTCTVVDVAGRSTTKTTHYRVIYGFTGFTGVVNPGKSNLATLNTPIEAGFRLTDVNGVGIDSLTSASFTAHAFACPAKTTAVAGSANPVGLVSLGNGYYRFVWTTPAAAACQKLILNTGDGETANHLLFVFQ